MATPTKAERRLYAAGFKKHTTWGAAVAVGEGDGLLLEGDGGLSRKQPYNPAKEADTPFVLVGDLGPIAAVDFSPPFTLRYNPGPFGTMMAMLFGTAGGPTKQGNSSVYKHLLQWADTIDGLFGTFVVERPGKILEVASAKPFGLTLNAGDGFIKSSISLRGNTVIDNSTVNAATQVDALTYADRGGRAKFAQLSAKMNAQADGNVASETALEINSIEISLPRALDAVHAAGSNAIIEPRETEHPVLTVKLGFPRANATNMAFFQTFTGEVPQKLLVKITGGVAGATTGIISAVGVTAGGTGYTVSDVLTVVGGTGGTVTVATVDEGVVTGVTLTTPGYGYTAGAGKTTTGGTGTNCTINIVSITSESYNYSYSFFFPRMRVTEFVSPFESEILTASITLQAEEASAAPSGMSYARPYCEIYNLRDTDYLA